MKRYLEELLSIIFVIFVIVSIMMFIEFPFKSLLGLIGLILAVKIGCRAWNCFSIKVLGRGSISKDIAVANRHELPSLFDRIVRDDLVKGKVTISKYRVLACGCEEPVSDEKMTAADARAHMQKLVTDFDALDNALDASNNVYFIFNTEHGKYRVSYRMIGPKSLELERKNMITFPPSAKFNTSTADTSLGVHYEGKKPVDAVANIS
jgi:hypothetical protein